MKAVRDMVNAKIPSPSPWEIDARGLNKTIKCPSGRAVVRGWNRDADAYLIAAAPDLLRALGDLLEDHKRMFPEAHPHSTIAWEECVEVQQALAAINKATNKKGTK
jgi:hypothetical protein